jgi:hypothetical protein
MTCFIKQGIKPELFQFSSEPDLHKCDAARRSLTNEILANFSLVVSFFLQCCLMRHNFLLMGQGHEKSVFNKHKGGCLAPST